MLNIRYKRLRLIPSDSAIRELMKYGLSIGDCKEILVNGYEPTRKRGKNVEKRIKIRYLR